MQNHTPTIAPHADFTPEQERLNTIIHAAGVLFGIAAIPVLIHLAAQHPLTASVFSVSVYGLCFLMTFTFSTLYHGIQRQKAKNFFKLLDRISIYFFIAGTYTPFILHYMFNETGIVLLSTIWGLVLLGILFELYLAKRFFFLSVVFYLVMGWMFIVVSKKFFASMPLPVIYLILCGVLLYSFGVIFYVWQKWKYHHAVWHSFVLAASICHFIAVWLTVSK